MWFPWPWAVVPKTGSGSDQEIFTKMNSHDWWKQRVETGLGFTSVTDLRVEINRITVG